MNIVKNIDQYNEDFVYFCEPIKNTIMNDGNFIRIIYSTPLVVFNGIYLYLSLTHTSIEKYFNKYRCSFDTNLYKNLINDLKSIEENILMKINIKGKIPQYKIYEQFKTGNIKIFADNIEKNDNVYLLKIAGIWETENNYGVTYKFIKL
jgi:hypothetical protein